MKIGNSGACGHIHVTEKDGAIHIAQEGDLVVCEGPSVGKLIAALARTQAARLARMTPTKPLRRVDSRVDEA